VPRQIAQFEFFTNSGGIPIVLDGQMVGAIGVGGGARAAAATRTAPSKGSRQPSAIMWRCRSIPPRPLRPAAADQTDRIPAH
jgi:hypothetical protein